MRSRHRLPSHALGAFAGLMALTVTLTVADRAHAERAPFSQGIIDAAMSEEALRYAPGEACPGPPYSSLKRIGTSHCVLKPAQAFYLLALTAYLDPAARSSDVRLVRDRVVDLFTTLTRDGNGPLVARPLDGWSDGPIAQALVLVRHTPLVWEALGPLGQAKATWLVRAMAILGNWAFNDANDWKTGIGLGGNFAKTNNPNFSQGYLGVMIACVLYFGQDGCDDVFTTFDYDDYITHFRAFNWQNLLTRTSWLAEIDARVEDRTIHYTMKELMEQGGDLTRSGPPAYTTNLGTGVGVRAPFRYQGLELTGDDVNQNPALTLFAYESIGVRPPSACPTALLPSSEPKPMYYWCVTTSVVAEDGTAQIIDGTASPFEGQLGMGYEFNSDDSAGTRSDALYTFEGWLNNLMTRATLQALGIWDREQMRRVDHRMTTGTRDLLYKLEHGYHGRALNANGPNTHYRDICVVDVEGLDIVCDPGDPQQKVEGTPLQKGYIYDRALWDTLSDIERLHEHDDGHHQHHHGHREQHQGKEEP